MGLSLLMGILYPFFGIHCFMNLAKTQIPRNSVCVDLSPYQFRFVWRQLESAFFGALTSVGALFILLGGIYARTVSYRT